MTGDRPPFAAIFDWDGVIIDSAKLHERSWLALAQEIGKEVAAGAFLRAFGMTSEHIIRSIHSWSSDADEIRRMSLRKEALYREIVRASGIEPLPGVTAWLAELKAAAIPCAIASSTHRLNIETVLEVIGLTSSFSAIVSAEDVTRGKPDPQVFLKAAERLATPPQLCVVFEDAHVGIEAARAANMRVIAVATTHPQGELRAADMAVERLDELSVAAVVRLLG